MLRIAGVLSLLIGLYVALSYSDEHAFDWSNLRDVANRQGRLGIATLGVGVLIITGAIDLSIGSVMGLASVSFGFLVQERHFHPFSALLLVMLGGAAIGIIHGLLVTQLKLQPFLVTLCGLFIYRGLTRLIWDKAIGLTSVATKNPDAQAGIEQLRWFLIGKDAKGQLIFPAEFYLMIGLALVIGLFLHFSIFGRYCYAIGHNEQAARYAGIKTDRYRIAGFVICSAFASLAGMLEFLDVGSVSPSNAGEGQELYAITAAVLGGCSLRGGDGTAIGIVIGAMVLKVLENLIIFLEIPDATQKAVIGLTLLGGTLVDEFFRSDFKRRKKIGLTVGVIVGAVLLRWLLR